MAARFEKAPEKWLKAFFSGGNSLSWASLETQTAPPRVLAHVMPWLKKMLEPGYGGPIILPRHAGSDRITWYAMADDERRFAQMIDEITGFVGPSYSDFHGQSAVLDRNDVCEGALAERFGSRVIKFSANKPTDIPTIERSLALYFSVLARRPATQDRTQRPFGKIRSDFDQALLTGNADSAQAFLEELQATGRINGEQRKCLEIRLLSGLGLKETLARSPALIAGVSDISLPAQTLVDIVVALYETFVLPIEADRDLPTILETFRRHIFLPFGGLFRERKGVRHPQVLRAFLLSELLAREPNHLRCQSLLAAYPEGAEGYELAAQWCKGISTPAPTPETDPKAVWLDQAKQAIADEDYEAASRSCLALLPLPWAYSALLRCAVEISVEPLTQQVLEVFLTASETVLAGMTDKDRQRLEKLRAPLTTAPPAASLGWVEWAENVLANPRQAPTIAALQEMTARWSVDEYALNSARCETLAKHIGNATGEAEKAFREAFAVLVEFFDGTENPRRAFQPIYSILLKVLGWSGSLSADELEIGAQLMRGLLTTGLSKAAYIEAISDFDEVFAANVSPVHFDWGLNLAELLLIYPNPDEGAARLRFFLNVVGKLRVAPHRITQVQRILLETLARDYNCPGLLDNFPVSSSEATITNTEISGYSGLIGIYTLTDGAGQRAKEILLRMLPQARVGLNGDANATDQLRALAKAADIFVFAWKSSKHQAYFCVKDARQGRETVLPLGKGSASILTGVLEKISASMRPAHLAH
jgi:hypothetical protein